MTNGSWLPEDGLTDDFFDLDFPLEDIKTANIDDWDIMFKHLIPPPLGDLTSLSFEFTGPAEIKKPAPIQSSSLEVSTVDTSVAPDVKVSKRFQSSSPVSVLDNTNGSPLFKRLAFPMKGTRSKRKRPTTSTLNVLRSSLWGMTKKWRKTEQQMSFYNNPDPFTSDGTVRKCTHCETIKTPQWRKGPNGLNTLCNACGVRFISGRLFPEYRPASSPTFIPTVHSNMHRKVVEMRVKCEDQFDAGMVHTA